MGWEVSKKEFDTIKSAGVGILNNRGCLNTPIGEVEELRHRPLRGRLRRLKVKITGIVPTGKCDGQSIVNLSVILPKYYNKDFRTD